MTKLQEWTIIRLQELIDNLKEEKVNVINLEDLPEEKHKLSKEIINYPATFTVTYKDNKND